MDNPEDQKLGRGSGGGIVPRSPVIKGWRIYLRGLFSLLGGLGSLLSRSWGALGFLGRSWGGL